jgi:hypothetical protein
LILTAAGVITGTPNSVGFYSFVVRATDGSGQSALKSLSISVGNPMTITTTSLPEGALWDTFSRCFSTTGSIGSRTFTAIANFAPGVSLATNGCISGTLTGIGSFPQTVTVTDSASPPQTASVSLTFRVSAPDASFFVAAGVNAQAIGQTSQRSVARTFTAGAAGTIYAAQVWGLSCSSQSPTVQVTARLWRGSPLTGEPFQTIATGTGDWFDPIRFSAPVTVGQGELYAIEFLIPSADCTISTPTTITYMPGDAWQKVGNGSFQRMVGSDVPFRILMQPLQSFVSMGAWRGGAAVASTSGGKFLIAGGDTNSADVYDPAGNSVTGTGSMAFPRTYATATALGSSGKVLITGGLNASGVALLTAEVYNPSTGIFTATANTMSVQRAQHTATPLSDGRVLIVGGAANGGGTASAEIYDPLTNAFTPAANMAGTRWYHSATLLNDGRVLVVGGNTTPPFVMPNGEVYNPISNTWTPTSGATQALRAQHSAFLLPDGRVMVVGGTRFYPALEPITEIYDPLTNQLTPGPSLVVPRRNPVVVNNLILGGTASDAFGQDGLADVERYNPITETFSYAGNLMVKRNLHTAVPIGGGKVAVIGGYNASALTGRSIEVFGPDPVPAFQPGTALDGQIGQSYGPFTFTLAGSSPFTQTFSSGWVPDGLAWTPTGSVGNATGFTLSSVPTAAGSFTFTVRATDSLGQARTQRLGIAIDPVKITTTQLPQATNGQPYSQAIAAASAHGPLTWKIISSTGAEVSIGSGLTPGLSLSSAGVVSGTPTASGFYTFNVRVRDSLGQSAMAIVGLFIP